MKICIIAVGSRGDIQPLLALGHELNKTGCEVRMATHRAFAELVSEYGIHFTPVVPENPREYLTTSQGRAFSSGNPLLSFAGAVGFFSSFRSILEQMLDACYEASEGCDAVISSIVSPGQHVAEALNIPCFVCGFWPAYPAGEYAHPVVPFDLGEHGNRLSHMLVDRLTMTMFRGPVSRWRKKMGLPALTLKEGIYGYVKRNSFPWLFGFSPSVIPSPVEWPRHVHACGYWYLDEPPGWQAPDYIEEFLSAGSKPVYLGFGSMVYRDAGYITEEFVKALGESGERGIIHSGWSGLGAAGLPDNVIKIDSVPHSWLFPRVKSAIHHGGSGTTAAALRAGIPNQIMPFLADQFFWAKAVARLGAGPPPLAKKDFNSENILNSIKLMSGSEDILRNASIVSEKIKDENGTGKAAGIIRAFLRG